MELLTTSIRGTEDALPFLSKKYKYIEDEIRSLTEAFGFGEIRTPVFEHTELFSRSVGDTTDVVQKEMYTFLDKGDRSITLKPEGTAGAVRAYLEHGLFNEPLPQKLFYFTPCYRYEKPQSGRLREFHQFGIECIGTDSPAADAEVISLGVSIFEYFELEGVSLQINSIGCPECRETYHKALYKYFSDNKKNLCPTCLGRLERNPMRILDCKNSECRDISENAPLIIDYICKDCSTHFEGVKTYLDLMQIEYTINPRIVRGLDYYTRTVFEFVSGDIGAQGTICGGGRYDGLIEELGGVHTPALGYAMGIERLYMQLVAENYDFPKDVDCDIFIASSGTDANHFASLLAYDLRNQLIKAQFDIVGRSIKAQMKYANKINAQFTIVIGDDELNSKKAMLKDMTTGESISVSLDTFANDFVNIIFNIMSEELRNSFALEELK